ncbi:MAG: phycobilisome rod-core linker polypeptide [Thermostichales cyanobacterium SZTDM-1c_bins_54]
MPTISQAPRLRVDGQAGVTPVELRPNPSTADLNAVVRAVYRQVLGNDHLFGADLLELQSTESLLRQGLLTVREFVRSVAKSEAYKKRFFYPNSQTRAIELNFKHLLGRAPTDGKDIARHLDIYQSKGHTGEIDSYIDSPEYTSAFGDNIVPYPRGYEYRPGHTTRDFTNLFTLNPGYAGNDRSQGPRPRLMMALGMGYAPAIVPESVNAGAPAPRFLGSNRSGDTETFVVEVTRLLNPGADLATSRRYRRSNQTLFISGDTLSQRLQQLLRSGARVVSIRRA